jgi:hypothetical protein
MINFKDRVKKLQPYVMSIRFNKGLTVIDTLFKEGWSVPKTNEVGYETIADKPNYYMLYGLTDDAGIDEILDYVEKVILLNVEREQKYELLRTKKKELEELFKKLPLSQCKTLQFKLATPTMERDSEDEEEYDIPLNEMPINMNEEAVYKPAPPPAPIVEEKVVPVHVRVTEETDATLKPVKTVDREVDPAIEAWNREAQRRENERIQAEPRTAKVGGETFDLPPREKVVVEVEDYREPQVVCKCDPNDPNQVCPVCMEYKY